MQTRGFLRLVRLRLRQTLVLDSLARLVALVIAAGLVVVAVDYRWHLPEEARLVALVALVLAAAALLHRLLLRPLRQPMDDRALAQLAERRLPRLDGRMLTQVDGIELGPAEGGTLATVLKPEAAIALVPAPALLRRLGVACLLILTLMAAAAVAPRLVIDGLQRFFLPLGGTEWERYSALEGRLERGVVAADEPLVVVARRQRGPEAALRLNWTPAGGGPVEHRVLSGLAGPWRQALTLPAGEWRLQVDSGDALPLVLRGRLVHRPVLKRVEAVLAPPAYTGLPAQQLATLGCAALPGSRLDFTLDFALDEGRQVAIAGLALGDQALAAVRTAHGLRGTFTVARGGTLVVRLADQDGIGPQPAPAFNLVLTEDRKPVVALDGPRRKETVTLRAEVAVAVAASDDYGLAELALRSRIVPGTAAAPAPDAAPDAAPEEWTVLAPFADVAGQTATRRATTVAVAKLAKPGDLLVLVGRALDANDVTGPGVGESQPLELKVVSEGELRQEFDRLLSEARDRVVQAREEIAQGLAKPDRLAMAGRGAALAAGKAGEATAQVVRRWRENRLLDEQLAPIAKADGLINVQALPRLAEAVKGLDQPARAADASLAEAEKLLTGLLQEGDITRLLAGLIEREQTLAAESRAFVREHLTGDLDQAAKTRQANLAQRQRELADLVKEVEHRLLTGNAQQLGAAQDLVRREGPADRLQQAAGDLASEKERTRAPQNQETALKTLLQILDLLRHSDAATDAARRAGELAAREEALVRQLEAGAMPQALAQEQRDLREDTQRFLDQLKGQSAAKAVNAATQAQAEAAKAMTGGDRAGAAQNGGAAASLLRSAQQQLGGEPDQPREPKDQRTADVLALLKELHGQQAVLVSDSTVIHQRLGDQPLDFPAQRELPALAEREGDIHLRLNEEAIKVLEGHAIALAALGRVDTALDRSAKHLATPALGGKGMRLERIALYELSRLIDIAENLPQPESGDAQNQGGQGGQQQAPFPPAAELALLAAMEEELALLTAANRPVDLAGMQRSAAKLVEQVIAASRPNSRPALLLTRSLRAMLSAGELLGQGDHGLTVRHEQAAAEAALRRLLAEAKAGKGADDGQNQPQQRRRDSGAPPEQKPQPTPGGAASPGGNAGGNQATPAGTGVAGGSGGDIHLPPERREQLRQAREQRLPPGALPVFERYLELLEEKP